MNTAFNFLGVGLKKYNKSLIDRPYRTKMATAGIIFAGADTFCQKIIEKKPDKKFDYRRLINMVLIGTFMSAPISHLWYCKWGNKLGAKLTTNSKLQPWVAMGLDQVLYTPVTLTMFLFMNQYAKDFSVLKAINNVREKLWRGMVANWKVWPPLVWINFALVPIHFRVLFVNVFGFFWTIYLTYLQNNGPAE